MNASLLEALFARYATVFRQRHLPVTESAMGWGIECGDGWYPLLDSLCAVVTEHARDTGHAVAEAKPRFRRTAICGDCNQAEGAAKVSLISKLGESAVPRWFSFSPREISRFIVVTDNLNHKMDTAKASALLKPSAEISMFFEDVRNGRWPLSMGAGPNFDGGRDGGEFAVGEFDDYDEVCRRLHLISDWGEGSLVRTGLDDFGQVSSYFGLRRMLTARAKQVIP